MNKRKNRRETIKQVLTITFSFIAGGLTLLFILSVTSKTGTIASRNNYTITKNKTKVYEKTSLAESISKIYDAVVVVQGYNGTKLEGTGSGFIYKVDENYGYILTNEHVLSKSNTIKIITTNDETIDGNLLGKDKYIDLAVIQIDKRYVSLIANIGSSKDANLGDTIFTVGAPLGYDYRGSVTSGILSGKERLVTTSTSTSTPDSSDWIMSVLQIDASINPGNSGGPLLNVNGEVIGICTLKLVDADVEGMGFAIPIEYAIDNLEYLENGQDIEWPEIGIEVANTSDMAILNRHNINVVNVPDKGAVIVEIEENKAGDKAKLQVGDTIIKINDKEIEDKAHFRYELYQFKAKDTIKITILRDNKEKIISMTLQ